MEQPFDLGHEFNWNGQVGVVGKYPFGLPCNIKITGIYDLCIILAGGFYGLIMISCLEKTLKLLYSLCCSYISGFML